MSANELLSSTWCSGRLPEPERNQQSWSHCFFFVALVHQQRSAVLLARKEAAARAQGGPGCASSGGGFLREHGPWFPNADVQDNGLRRNEFSWHRAASIIYLDQPAYTGFSYSNRSSDRYAGARHAVPARQRAGAHKHVMALHVAARQRCTAKVCCLTPEHTGSALVSPPCNEQLVLTSGRPVPSGCHRGRSAWVQLHGARVRCVPAPAA